MKSISHAPNTDSKQQLRSLGYLLLPWNWFKLRRGIHSKQLESQFLETILKEESSHAFTFSAGREALAAILKAMNIGTSTDDEVIIQAYTCIVVPNAVIWSGARPVYVDINSSYNLDPNLLEAAITPNTKAIIVQHTFGYPAQMKQIMDIANRNQLPLIEDCAHSLGATIDGKPVGTFGVASIFSFGRDKIISSVAGGIAYTANKDIASELKHIEMSAPHRPISWLIQSLVHPLVIPLFSRLSGRLKIGQLLTIVFQKLGLLNKVYRSGECDADTPKVPFYKMPNALAHLAADQLTKLPQTIAHRAKLATVYDNELDTDTIPKQVQISGSSAYLRYTVQVPTRDQLMSLAQKRGYLLGNWYQDVVMPRPKDWKTIHYTPGSCPVAEALIKQNVNLPTSQKFTEKDAQIISDLVKQSYE
jgi:perosamine synthetase